MEEKPRDKLRRKPRVSLRTFMTAYDFRRIRVHVLEVPQSVLAGQLIDPVTGRPISQVVISHWEHSRTAIPLWAARRMNALAERAAEYDAGMKRG